MPDLPDMKPGNFKRMTIQDGKLSFWAYFYVLHIHPRSCISFLEARGENFNKVTPGPVAVLQGETVLQYKLVSFRVIVPHNRHKMWCAQCVFCFLDVAAANCFHPKIKRFFYG